MSYLVTRKPSKILATYKYNNNNLWHRLSQIIIHGLVDFTGDDVAYSLNTHFRVPCESPCDVFGTWILDVQYMVGSTSPAWLVKL